MGYAYITGAGEAGAKGMRSVIHQASVTTPASAKRTFTLLAVHAHPDDESSGTGGLLRLAAEQGHTTVLVTCTNGDLGDVKDRRLRLQPRDNPTDRQRLAAVRHTELRKAAAILGVTHLYALGYHDSGMHGWETNAEPQAFAQAKVEDVAGHLERRALTVGAVEVQGGERACNTVEIPRHVDQRGIDFLKPSK